MVGNNVLLEKTLAFAIRVVNCNKFLVNDKKELIMSKQLLRCGTSIGANSYEAVYAQSKSDFISKLSIALKEASETSYWLMLLHRTSYLEGDPYNSMRTDLDEIIRILVKTIKTTKNNEQGE